MTACGCLCHCITALGYLSLAKTARRRLRPPCGAFFWPCAAFACLYRLYTDTSSKIYLCEGIIQILVAKYCTNVYYSFLARENCSNRYRASLCSQRVEGTTSGERASSIDPQAPGKSQTIIV